MKTRTNGSAATKAKDEVFQQLLAGARAEDKAATERLAELVLGDFRRIARAKMVRQYGPGLDRLSFQPTMLANDTFMEMLRQTSDFKGLAHFFAVACGKMWEDLIDYQRRRKVRRPKDGAMLVSLDFDVAQADGGMQSVETEALYEALEQLGKLNPRARQAFELRALFGLSIEEVAAAMNISAATVSRDVLFARAWIKRALGTGASEKG